MGKKKYAKNPLLYIHQPRIKNPEAPMQHHYASPKHKSNIAPSSAKLTESGKRQPAYFRELAQLQEQQNVKNPDVYDEREDTEKTKDVLGENDTQKADDAKNFQDMSLEEKVNYFVYSPKYVPKIKCKLQTKERTYRGIITEFQEGQVFVRTGKSLKSIKIPFEQITDVKMLGF